VAAPLVALARFRDPVLGASLALSAVVMTVAMATLVVGPFYLSRALGLGPAQVGLVMSSGPFVAALTAVMAGRLADRFGASRIVAVGLAAMGSGAALLSAVAPSFGVPGYLGSIAVLTVGYALFQTSNTTVVMADVAASERGVISGLLNLSRFLGSITGASAMGAVFAFAAGTDDILAATVDAVSTGLRVTFAVAAGLIVVALGIAAGSRSWVRRAKA
jgi:MFS family permease